MRLCIKISTMKRGKTWRFRTENDLFEVKRLLLELGGEEKDVAADFELWRIRLADSTFTAYKTLKLYSTPSDDPLVRDAVERIDRIAGALFVPPESPLMVGCDEAGKGEILGSIFVSCALVPSLLFHKLQDILRTVDTKARRHPFSYWKTIFEEIHALKTEGLDAVIKRIPPESIDRENINVLLDKAYVLALKALHEKYDLSDARLVIDDYGVGDILREFIDRIRPSKVIIATRADEKYLEVLTASVISKYFREREMDSISSDERWIIDGVSPGPGSPNNPQTLEWLKSWHESGREWPNFVRKSYRTIAQIEGREFRRKGNRQPKRP